MIFLFAFTLRFILVLTSRQYLDLQRFELERVAISLATSGVFGNPYALPTGPTAHVAPGYVLVLAAIFRIFGAGTAAELIKQTLACAISALGYAFTPIAAVALGISPAVGTAAALAGAALPFRQTETLGDWEAPISSLLLILTVWTVTHLWRSSRFRAVDALSSGLQWGLTLLFIPAFLILYAGYFIATLRLHAPQTRKLLVFSMAQAALVTILLLPWAVRNYISLGSMIFTRTNLGLELRLSNNNQAGPSETANFNKGVYHAYHPLQNMNEARKVLFLGEVAYNRQARKEAMEWIRTHPKTFIRLTAGRWTEFWFPVHLSWSRAAWLWLTSIGMVAGLYLLMRFNRISAMALFLPLLLYPLPHYLVHVNVRHRYPLQWICTLLTAYAISILVVSWRNTLSRSQPRLAASGQV